MAHIICRTCRRPLSEYVNASGSWWDHATHFLDTEIGCQEPVPIDSEEVGVSAVSVCDFCSGVPTVVYPAKSFTMPGDQGSVGGWAACPECIVFIERGDAKTLTRRAIATAEAQVREPFTAAERRLLGDALGVVHRRFLAARTGPPSPINEYQETEERL